jgi:hypothetical protein
MSVSMHYSAFLKAPQVRWNHVDGPLLEWACFMHWLTLWERLCLWMGLKSLDGIAEARFPEYRRLQMQAIMQHNEAWAQASLREDRP